MIKSIALYDPSIATSNVGDEIISEAVKNELMHLFKDSQFISLPTHSKRSLGIIKKANSCDLSFVGGSNLLSPNMLRYQQFKLSIYDFLNTKNLILMGTGWQCYSKNTDILARYFYNNNLSKKYMLSVRDDYTAEKLLSIGVTNVINTGCPTMWRLNKEHCSKISKSKRDKVIFTLTDYSQDYNADKYFINIIKKNYSYVYFWPQGMNDLKYLSTLTNVSDINIIPPRLTDYNNFLLHNECDYIGTRLHGGVKALQHYKRTFIIGIDNRANEKNKDFNLFVLKREAIKELDDVINSCITTDIKLNYNAIEKFKSQFMK
ncbi:polysaccharide pyruvyl transferase family protein [Providencia rettgeri]|uniref:polysaccharide pyruvyl transferase family protein n=1 Tax=Providencia sp. PROV021 TaxID=2949756 RepID=UPI00189DA9E2|nr:MULTISPECIES: polysaccharide pyruvyl transferase family protein [Providencia]ELR5257061.1 polysaccharide pyruvyl transferase family protein [Providencia rettgeri]QPE17052.1 polysaccharide pyruvyl transferase family protein [Providencia rettgeri]